VSVTDGQAASAATLNAAFASKIADNTSTGVQTLNNTAVTASGAQITNVQRAINLCMSVLGLSGETDATGNIYASLVYLVSGDAVKVAIGKLDAAISALQTQVTALALPFTQFLLANNTTATIPALIFNSATYQTFEIKYYIYRESISTGANKKGQRGRILGAWNGTSWEIADGEATPTDCGVTFTIDPTSGQISYTTDNQAGTFQAPTSYMNYKIADKGV
jgi:hypothetical protein